MSPPEAMRVLRRIEEGASVRESVSCSLCDSADARLWARVQDYRIVECRNCGLRFVSPRPPDEPGADAFSADDYEHALEIEDDKRDYFHRRLEELKQFVETSADRRLLDVGASTGLFVDLARAFGWAAHVSLLSPDPHGDA